MIPTFVVQIVIEEVCICMSSCVTRTINPFIVVSVGVGPLFQTWVHCFQAHNMALPTLLCGIQVFVYLSGVFSFKIISIIIIITILFGCTRFVIIKVSHDCERKRYGLITSCNWRMSQDFYQEYLNIIVCNVKIKRKKR